MKKFKPVLKVGLTLMLAIFLNACYPTDTIPISDLDTVTTLYQAEDFATAPTTAALNYTVIRIEGDDPENDLPYDGEVDEEILETTLQELRALYGVENVVIIQSEADLSALDTIDVFVVPHIMLKTVTIGTVYPGWGYGGWYGGWYPGYGGCYYCGYPPQVSYRTYEGGSVVLDMWNTKMIRKAIDDNGGQVPDDAEYDPSWLANFSGLISSNPSSNSQRVIDGIVQAFDQSKDYLK
jgi:hypothetical protein